MSIESVMLSNHLILCPSLLLLSAIFSSESALRISWLLAKLLEFQASIECLGLTSWISLQSKGLKSLLQHHSSKASFLLCSAFFIVQLSHPYMTTGKTTALTRQTFVGKVMSLLLNMLSRLVITFLPLVFSIFRWEEYLLWAWNT